VEACFVGAAAKAGAGWGGAKTAGDTVTIEAVRLATRAREGERKIEAASEEEEEGEEEFEANAASAEASVAGQVGVDWRFLTASSQLAIPIGGVTRFSRNVEGWREEEERKMVLIELVEADELEREDDADMM
jgi:hypothetical protein